MKAIRLDQPGRLTAFEMEPPDAPLSEEAVVRVRRIGVCGTDLHAFQGNQPFFTYPRILGHELGVEVVAVGAGLKGLRVGELCSVEPYLNCGTCISCRRGKPNCCAHLAVLGVHADGGMREEFKLPARKLHSSARLTLDQLALVETLGIGCHAVDRAQLEQGERVLVIGAGPIGLSVIQFAVAAGANVVVIDVNLERLEFCRERLGVLHALDAGKEDLLESLVTLARGDLPTAVFDATGNRRSMEAAFDYVAPGGRLVLVGLVLGEVHFNDPSFHRRELTLLATRNALPTDFTRIIGLIEAGRINTSPWITHRANFDQVVAKFPSWTMPGSGLIKAMIEL